ncbi:MAG: ATP-binding protein [Sphingobacteriaceae bacterium]|nr:ATP-binding protein [Sphingobacteriaceae bacterium]
MENSKIIKIAVVGPESTGKTVLCEQLALHYNTIFVPEYARDYFLTKNIEGHTKEDLNIIYEKQILSESKIVKQANRFLFCDTNLISGKVWADVVFKSAPEFISQNISNTNHDLHLLCDIDLPWVADEQRRNEYNRKEIMQMHVNELQKLGLNFEIIKGFDKDRVKNAIIAISKYF